MADPTVKPPKLSVTLPPRWQPSDPWEETSQAYVATSPALWGRASQRRTRCGPHSHEFLHLVRAGIDRCEYITCTLIHARVEKNRVGWGTSFRKGQLSPVLIGGGRGFQAAGRMFLLVECGGNSDVWHEMRMGRWAGTCKALKARLRGLLLTLRNRRTTERCWEGGGLMKS